MPHRVVWTREMDRALMHWRGRVRPAELAERIGVGLAVMYARLHAIGAPVRAHVEHGPRRPRRAPPS